MDSTASRQTLVLSLVRALCGEVHPGLRQASIETNENAFLSFASASSTTVQLPVSRKRAVLAQPQRSLRTWLHPGTSMSNMCLFPPLVP
ncbi:hypothetical protein XA1311A_24030 [Xanthomonas arboricola]|nr:hypothetical protein XA1311A_24030 [Xanthomonas arboricola]CAE6781095.1 hypothetical protein XA1311A_24030 [Xanthomonas arboricola]